MNYPKTSPYFATNTFGNNYLDIMQDREIPKLASDLAWTITEVYNLRPDLLAYDLYEDSRLWWVFSSRNPNRLKDPLFDFLTGTTIYIPKIDVLKEVLGF